MRSAEYRDMAHQCRRIASLLKGDSRSELLEVAAAWDRLAEDSEKRCGAYFGLGSSPYATALAQTD